MLPYKPSKKTTECILEFYKQSVALVNSQWNLREQLRQIDLSYLRENDYTEEQWKAKIANMRGDPTKFQNITLPIVMPQVEAAVTYQQSVFLSGFPIFGATATPEYVDAAAQMDAIIGDQQVEGNWVPELLRSLRNGFKYNIGPTEVSWERNTSFALEDASAAGSTEDGVDRQKEVIWEGNEIKSLDPYNTFWDTRVLAQDVCRWGEFAGYTQLMSRIRLKDFVASLPTRINVTEAFESGSSIQPVGGTSGIESYHIPLLNPESLYEAYKFVSTDWLAWAGLASDKSPRINYKNLYEVTTIYGRILPSDFGMTNVPGQNTPQVWKFIIVNHCTVIYAERLTNVHGLIPIFFASPVDDGLGYQSKSFARNVMPFQEITTALSNSIVAARRRAISDRLLYDPSRVSDSLIKSDSPVARIPVRPHAYGTDLSAAVYQIPFRDDQSPLAMQAVQQFAAMANQVSGLNPARQGQFVKGNKTRAEFEEIMGYANGRDQTVAITLEGNFFAPIKKVIKANILQYQGGTSVFDRENNRVIQVDPLLLRKANVVFKLSDGLLPSDKMIDGESLALAFQTIASSPELAQGYNLVPMFSYLMKTRGAKLHAFEKPPEQLAYEQALAVWQQTVAALGEQLAQRDPPVSAEEFQSMLPPQPTPEQYGFDPKLPQVSVMHDGQTVFGRFAQTSQQLEQIRNTEAAQAQAQQGGQPSGEPS